QGRRSRSGGGVPERHVDAGEREADDAWRIEQGQRPPELALDLDGREHIALDRLEETLRGAGDGSERPWGEAEHVRAARDGLIGLEVEEDQRGFRDGAAGADRRPGKWDEHGTGAERANLHGGRIALGIAPCQDVAALSLVDEREAPRGHGSYMSRVLTARAHGRRLDRHFIIGATPRADTDTRRP